MLRFFAGVGSALLLIAAGFFFWQGRAEREDPIPPPPARPAMTAPFSLQTPAAPPAASEKTKEEKRFARADKDKDGGIAREEMMAPRRKAYAKLDTNGDGRLSFEEWAVKTVEKFAAADADRNGALTPAEYATTRPKPSRTKKKCAC